MKDQTCLCYTGRDFASEGQMAHKAKDPVLQRSCKSCAFRRDMPGPRSIVEPMCLADPENPIRCADNLSNIDGCGTSLSFWKAA